MKTSAKVVFALLSFTLSVLSEAAFAQADPIWTMRYAEPGFLTNIPVASVVDGAGNLYVTGYTDDAAASNGWVTLKYNASGALLWTAHYAGSTNGDRPAAMALDSNGNIYITGCAYDAVAQYDFATLKYDPAGNLLWARRSNGLGNGEDRAKAIAVDSAGNVYVTGTAYVSTYTDPYLHLTIVNTTYLTIKYDSAGNQLWERAYDRNGTGFNQDAQSLALDSAGNAYVAGISVFVAEPRSPGYGLAVVKYAPNGTELGIWRTDSGAPNGAGFNANIFVAAGPSNEVYVAGTFNEAGPLYYKILKYTNDVQAWTQDYYGINPYSGEGNRLRAMAVDKQGNLFLSCDGGNMSGVMVCMTMKYDPSGAQLWSMSHNRTLTNNEYARALTLDESGNAYVSAFSLGASNSSAFVTLKYAPTGLLLWVAEYSGQGLNEPHALALDAQGALYVTGASAGSSGLDITTLKYAPVNQANMSWLNGSVTLTAVAAPGSTNWLQVSSDLRNWSDVCSSVTRVDGVCFFPCISQVLTSSAAFFRVSYR